MLRQRALTGAFGRGPTAVLPWRPGRTPDENASNARAQNATGELHLINKDLDLAPRGEAKRRANDYPDLLWFACISILLLALIGFVAAATV
jgi:hypothetical protein